MAEEVTTLSLGVDSSGVDRGSESLGDFVRQGKAAERQAEGFASAFGKTAKINTKGIDEYIRKLKFQAEGLGATAVQQKLIELAAKGATAAQIEEAKAVLNTIDAYKQKEKAAVSAERAAEKESRGKIQTSSVVKGTAIGTLIGQGIGAAIRGVRSLAEEFERLTESAAKYKDIEESFGGSAESFASLDISAHAAGISIESIGEASAKLTRGLVGVDDETKNAGAALKALGVNVQEFKQLDPATQFEQLGSALAKYADGTQKTAVAQALFGRGGAKMLVFLKELEAAGGRQVILTQAQIDLADDYKDAQARVSGQLDQYLKLIALQALPGVVALKGVFIDLAKEMLGVDSKGSMLATANHVRKFAEDAAVAIGSLSDFIANAINGLVAFATSIPLAFAQASLSFSKLSENIPKIPGLDLFGVGGRAQSVDEATKEFLAASDRNGKAIDAFVNRDADKFANLVRARIQQNRDLEKTNDEQRKNLKGRPALDFDGKEAKAKAKKPKKTPGEVTDKDILGFDIQGFKDALRDLTAARQDAASIFDAQRAAGLVDDADYYAQKLSALRQANLEETNELRLEIDRRQQFINEGKGTDKDRLNEVREIGKAKSEIARKNASEGAKEEVLEIQRAGALNNTKASYEDSRLAAQNYLDTIARQHQLELQAFSLGDVEQRRVAGRAQVEDTYAAKRADLERNKQLLSLQNLFNKDAREKYNEQLQIIENFQAKALIEWDDYYARLRDAENDWHNGITRGLANISDTAGFTAKNTEGLITNTFKGFEDAIVSAATGGKASFKEMINSFISDIIRLIVQQQYIKPIAEYLKGEESGGNGFLSTIVSAVANIALGGSGSTGLSTAEYSTSGFATGTNPDYGNEGLRGQRAVGGTVSKNSLYEVNETKEPEVLTVAGRQYLMMGNQMGQIQAADDRGNKTNAEPSQPSSGRPVTLTVINNGAPAKATTTQRETPQGTIIELILETVASDVDAGGRTAGAFSRRFGANGAAGVPRY